MYFKKLYYHSILQEGRDLFDKLYNTSMIIMPDYFDELKGIEAGSNLPSNWTFLLSFKPELQAFYKNQTIIDEDCTDILYKKDDTLIIGHNEDNVIEYLNYSYLITIEYQNNIFTSYCYPGLLAGNTFSHNVHGLVITSNALTPKISNIDGSGLARYWINRALIDMKSIQSIQKLLEKYSVYIVFGFSSNIADIYQNRLIQVEVAPLGVYDMHELSNEEIYGHANHYIRLNQAQHISNSSYYRQLEIDQVLSQIQYHINDDRTALKQIMSLLGDTSNKLYPIYRTGTAPDTSDTFCTAIFRLNSENLSQSFLSIYLDNPISTLPIYTFQLHNSIHNDLELDIK